VTKNHPVSTLLKNLEGARLRSVEALAAADTIPPNALQDLATLQAALMAVREEIQAHGVGWGGEDAVD
jgi:hypothetical protein